MIEETALSQNNATPPASLEVLLTRVRGLPDRRKLRAWLFPSTMSLVFVAAMVWLGTTGHLETRWPALAALVLVCGPGIWIWSLIERREIRTIEALTTFKELRALGGLLESVTCSNRRVRKMVQTALLDLLPRLTEEDSGLLDTSHREILNALLYHKSGELAMGALFAIEQVGDGTALPYLTSIAAGKGVPGSLRNRKPEVQERARLTVETIRERIERHNRVNVLLRASQVPGTPSEQLVRPAYSSSLRNEQNGQELLRPGMSVEQNEDQHYEYPHYADHHEDQKQNADHNEGHNGNQEEQKEDGL